MVKNNNLIFILALIAVIFLAGIFILGGKKAKAPSSQEEVGLSSEEFTEPPVPPPAPGSQEEQEMTNQAEEEPAPQEALPEKNVIVYDGTSFKPSTLEISAGEVVVFINESSQDFWPASAIHPTHTLYSGTSLSEHCGTDKEDTAFDACRPFPPESIWSFQFTKKGTWGYHDHLNPSAVGKIIVK